MTAEGFDPFAIERGQKKFGYINVVDTISTGKVDIPVGVVNGSASGPTFAVTGGCAPTEYDGVEAAARLYQSIDPKDLTGRLVIVPVVYMPVFQFRSPWFSLTQSIGLMDGLSLYYAFPGDVKGTLTQIVAYKLFNEIILKSNYHVDLRGGDLNESHLVHTIFCRGISKEIDKISEEMVKVVGYEYVLPGAPEIQHTGPRTLIYETLKRGIPSIITESGLGYRTQPLEEYVMLHVDGVRNLLKYLGMLKGSLSKPKNQRFLDMTWYRVKAPVAGVFHAKADQGNEPKKGEVLGIITSLDGSELCKVTSPFDGVVHTMFPRRVVFPGDNLFSLLQIGEPTGW
jgi:predicted deacylase